MLEDKIIDTLKSMDERFSKEMTLLREDIKNLKLREIDCEPYEAINVTEIEELLVRCEKTKFAIGIIGFFTGINALILIYVMLNA